MKKTIKIRVEISNYTTDAEKTRIVETISKAVADYNTTVANTVTIEKIWFARK